MATGGSRPPFVRELTIDKQQTYNKERYLTLPNGTVPTERRAT